MSDVVIVAIISFIGTVVGSLFGILAANKLTNYRVEELEKKVDKHNTVIERVVVLEQSVNTAWKRIDEIRESLEEIKKEVYSKET
jgi:tetrahydromethanopterin S-methyltransferase subunit G